MDIGDRFSPDFIFKESAIAPISNHCQSQPGNRIARTWLNT